MQNDSGLQRLLTIPFIYNSFQEVVGANAARRKFINEYMRPKPADKIIDFGCGPAQMLSWMPASVEYIGIDASPLYIDVARKNYGQRGLFLVGDTSALKKNDERLRNADIILCAGVFHHLNDDEALEVMKFGYMSLKKGGRLLSFDPCWIPNQGVLSKWIISKDRGKNVRTEEGYRAIAITQFNDIKVVIDPKPMRIPSASILLECTK